MDTENQKNPEEQTELDGLRSGQELTQKQELFCRLYTQNGECFGNGTLAYAEAYNYDLESFSKENKTDDSGKTIRNSSDYQRMYDNCSAAGSRLLRIGKINSRCQELLQELLNDEVVDSELVRVIMQNKDRPSKVAAIREYNKLKNRITERSAVDVTTGGKSLLKLIQDGNRSDQGAAREQILADAEPVQNQDRQEPGTDEVQPGATGLPTEAIQ